MNIKVFQNRKIEKDYFYNEGTQNENNSTVLTFEVPLGYEDFSKRIVFITEDGNFWDYIPENEYEIKNNITKYETVEAYLWLTKDDQDFRSQNFELNFYDNENADDLVPAEEEIDGFKTLIAELDIKIAEVEALKVEIGDFQQALNSKATKEELKAVDAKFENYYLKTETYNKEEIDNKISVIPKFNRIVVDELPTENIREDAVYLVPSQGDTNDLYREYLYINGNWELIGIQKGDLSNIYTKQEVDEMVKEIQETNEYQSEIIDQFKNEFKQITVSGDSIYIPDAAELPIELVPYGEPVQEVILEELGTTIEGETVVVADGNPEKEVKATVNGNSYQETTEGYQLFNKDEVVRNKYINNLGEILESNYFSISSPIPVISGGNITYKGLTDVGMTVYSNFYNENDEVVETFKQQTGVNTKSVPSNATYVIFSIRDYESDTDVPTFQVVNGTEEKPYEPYTNGASPNTEYKQDIEVIDGVNELNWNNIVDNSAWNETGKTTNSVCWAINDYQEVKSNEITFKANFEVLSGTQGRILTYDENKTLISNTAITTFPYTKEFESNAKYYAYYFLKSMVALNSEFMITKYKDLPYLPYEHIGLVQKGKQLIDWQKYSKREADATFGNDILTVTNTGTNFPRVEYNILEIIKKNPGKKLYFNCESYDFSKAVNAKVQLVVIINGETKYAGLMSQSGNKEPYTIPENSDEITYAQLGFYANNSNAEGSFTAVFTKPILSFKENDTYEPYIEPIVHEIDLAGNSIAKVNDVDDKLKIYTNGNVELPKNVVETILDSNWNWVINATTDTYVEFMYTGLNPKAVAGYKSAISNYFSNKVDNRVITNDVQILIRVPISSNITTLEQWKAFLTDNTVKVIYERAETEVIDLPSIEPIKLIEGITNVFELVTNLGTTMALTYDYVTPSPSIDRPSEILTVKGSYDTELKNEDASIINNLPLTLTNELLGEIVTLTEEEAKQLNLDGAGKYRRSDLKRTKLTSAMSWKTSSNGYWYYVDLTYLGYDSNSYGAIWSNYFKSGKWFFGNTSTPNIIALGNTVGSIVGISIATFESIDALKTFLDENEVYIIGQLATPTYEKITDETELEQLSDYDKQIAFFGINNINTYPTDDLVKAPLKIHATYSKSNKLTIQSLEDRLASLESQVTNLQDNQI